MPEEELFDELELEEDEELALLAPESVTEVACTVPLEAALPATTTCSPGYSFFRETVSLFVILVALESFTLTVLPLVSVT